MPAPLPAEKRDAIERDIRTGQLSRNAIARKHDVSVGSVTNIAKKITEQTGQTPFDRSATKDATEARRADIRAMHAELTEALASDAQNYRRVLASEVAKAVTGQSRSLIDAQRMAVIMGIVTDKYRVLRDMDQPAGVEEGKGLIDELIEGLRRG